MMELTSGFILTEVFSKDRKEKTWWKKAGKVLSKLKNILSLTCDGAGALKNIAKRSSCQVISDLFHGQQDISESI